MASTTDLQPFMCTDTAKWDTVYEHDFIVNINNITYTYCMDLTFMGYKRGECVGIKSLLPGQKLTQRHTASYSQIVFDETGKQVAMTDSSSAETELIDAVSNNLTNVTNSSNASTTNWNVSASAGLDLGMFGSYGASGGGSGTDTHTDFTETFESCITNSVSKVKNKKASSNMATFNSLHNTTTTNTTSSDTIDVIENLSNTKIAVYYFYTMYKVYYSRLYIKRAKTNWVMQSIVNMNPSIKRNVNLSGVPAKGVTNFAGVPAKGVTNFAGVPADFAGVPADFAGVPADFAGKGGATNGLIGTNGKGVLDFAGVPADFAGKGGATNGLIGTNGKGVLDFAGVPADFAGVPADFAAPGGATNGRGVLDFAGVAADLAANLLSEDSTSFKSLQTVTTTAAITTEEQQRAALAKAKAENDIIKLRRNSVLPKVLMLPIDGFYITGENSHIVLDAFSK